MIRSFADKDLELLVSNGPSSTTKRIPTDLYRIIVRKVAYLNQAIRLEDLRIPPANRLERLKGDLAGQYSSRVNDQYRLVFCWENGEVKDLRFMDYH